MSIYIPYLSSIPFKSELYLNRYSKFIESCLEANKSLPPDVYTEEHHVLPKASSMFPQFINLRQHPWNAARLTARQHLIAHRMLKKAYMNVPMCRAVTLMVGKNERNSRWYEQAKIDFAAALRGRTFSEETRMKISIAKKGKPRKPHSEEIKMKISKTLQGRTLSEETRMNMSIAFTGRTFSEETRMKMSESKKGKPRKPHTEETKNKMSIAQQGQNNYRFKGFYQTPFGTFESTTAASEATSGGISAGAITKWCKKDNLKVISNRTFTKSPFLQDNYAREDVVGKKTFNDLGFSFLSI